MCSKCSSPIRSPAYAWCVSCATRFARARHSITLRGRWRRARAQPRLRASAVLACDDAGAAGPLGPGPARHGGPRRDRRWLRRNHRRAAARPAGATVTLLEAQPSAGAAPPGTAASSTPATSGARPTCSAATARRPAPALPGHARLFRSRSPADRRGFDRLRLARARHARAGIRGLPRGRPRGHPRRLSTVGMEARILPRERIREEIGSDAYYGALAVDVGGCSTRPAITQASPRPPTVPARTCMRGSVHARSGARPTAGSSSRRRGSILAREVLVARTATRTAWRQASGDGSCRSAATSSPASHSPRTSRELSPTGRAFWDTKYFLYYWHVSADRRMIFGGRTSFLPTSMDRSAAILHRDCSRSTRSSPTIQSNTPGAATSASRSTACRTRAGSDGVICRGLLRHRRRAHDRAGKAGRRWLAGDPAPALTRLGFPLVPAPYEGHPWFLPFVGECIA